MSSGFTDAELRNHFQDLQNRFKAPNGALYILTGKDSLKKLTLEDWDKLVTSIPDTPGAMLTLLAYDKPDIAEAITPAGISAAEFHRYMLAKLAAQGRPTDIYRGESTKEGTKEYSINGQPVQLKPSEFYSFTLNKVLLADANTPLTPLEQRLKNDNANLSDVAVLASGYAAGAVPTFNPRITPDTNAPMSINIGADVNAIQNWYCEEIKKPFERNGNDLDNKTAYTLGFIQARTDARNNFEVSGGVGITEPCPPAQTPNTGIANGNGTSSVNQQGGGAGPVSAPSAKGR